MSLNFGNNWKNNMILIRDVIFVLGFLISVAGWIRSSAIKETKTDSQITLLKNEISSLRDEVNSGNEQLKKINDILMDQKELNGKIILYMEMR